MAGEGLFDDLPEVSSGAKPATPVTGGIPPMASAHLGGRFYPPPPNEPGLQDEGIGPLELLTFANPAAKAGKAIQPLVRGLTRAQAMALESAAVNAGFMAPERLSRGEAVNPATVVQDATAGAVLGRVAAPVMEALGRAMPRRGIPAAPARTPSPEALAAESPTIRLPKEPTAGGAAASEFTGKSAQQQTAAMSGPYAQRVLGDPEYLQRLKDLGGGRVQTNEQTLAAALQAGPMEPEAIAAWKAETPTNAVEQTRALITKDYLQNQFLGALQKGDTRAATEAMASLKHIEPGIQNIRATPGRAAQAQAMFVQDKVAAAFSELADMQEKGVPFEQVQEAANKKLAELARDQSLRRAGATATRWINALETYSTAAKLTSPVTHAVNTISNAITFMVQRPLEKTASAAAHLAAGNRVAAEGEMQAMFGTTQGFVDGARRYLRVLMEDSPDLGKGAEAAPSRYRLPRALRPLDPFRQLSAADAFWKGALEDARIYESAYKSARRQGLKGSALAKRIEELRQSPPEAWRTDAQKYAQEFTFQEDPDGFLKAIGKLRNVPGMRLIIPFIQTPYNIGKFQFQRSPLGVVSPRNVRGFMAGGEARAEAIGRLASGAALSTAAWSLVQQGNVTGSYPSDPGERALWEAEGRQPYSVRIGNRWLAYNRFAPVGMYLGQAAAMNDAIRGGELKQAGSIFSRMMAETGKQILDMPFVSGLSSLMDAIQDPERSATRFVSGVGTGLVPNILRDVRQQTDPTRREVRGLLPPVVNMIPGASQTLQPKVDVLGREVRYPENRLVRGVKVLQDARETPETRTLRDARYSPSKPQSRLFKRGEQVKLEGPESTQFQREMGEATRRAIQAVSSKPGFAELDQDEKDSRLKRAIDRERTKVRSAWKGKKFQTAPRNEKPRIDLFGDLPEVVNR